MYEKFVCMAYENLKKIHKKNVLDPVYLEFLS
jgi:hypothetical protein